MNMNSARDQNGEIKIETQAFELYSSDTSYILANVYSRGCDFESLNNLSSLISASSEVKELLITGDFNSQMFTTGTSIPSTTKQKKLLFFLSMAKRSIPDKNKYLSKKKMVPCYNDSCERVVRER